MASININNAPGAVDLELHKFKSVSDASGGPAKSCRFVARILNRGGALLTNSSMGIRRDLAYLCEAAEYPSRGFLNIDIRYYGPNQKLPYQSQYEDITLTFVCRNNSMEREFFDNWQNLIHPNNNFDFNYRDEYSANIEIFHFDDQNKPQYYFTLLDAYPILVNTQALTWADDQFLRLGVTFTYSWWTRPGLDTPVRTSSENGASFKLTPTQIR